MASLDVCSGSWRAGPGNLVTVVSAGCGYAAFGVCPEEAQGGLWPAGEGRQFLALSFPPAVFEKVR
jgi:hypothetical protein